MAWTTINVSSITNAMRGKSILERQGYTVQIQRIYAVDDNNGCGYRLMIKGDASFAENILRKNGVRLNGIQRGADR